jgi:uncharacterized protein
VSRPLRVAPRVWIGVAIWLGYVVVVLVLQLLSGVPYTAWGDSGANLFLGAGVSLIAATVLLAVTTTLLGWWRPVLFERRRSRHRWPVVAPLLMAGVLVLNLGVTDWASFDGAFLAAATVLVLVGFTEEITARGLLLVALRSRVREVFVWLLTSLAFGVMHMVNGLLGQPVVPTVQQAAQAFVLGTTFYILRRTTGTLVWAMVLHGLWDFSVFASGYAVASPALLGLGSALVLVVGLLSLVAVRWTITDADEAVSPAERTASPV